MDKDLEIDKLKMRFSRLEESLARALERIALLERRAQQSAPRLEVVTRGELESDEDEDTSPQNVVLALSLEVLELSPEAVVWLTSHQIQLRQACEAAALAGAAGRGRAAGARCRGGHVDSEVGRSLGGARARYGCGGAAENAQREGVAMAVAAARGFFEVRLACDGRTEKPTQCA